ncbi:Calx-beta domain-containing protein [Limibacter armeniacum]|uniref:Calx-beta domain-containing protein n=1 Tax=Limibacter armeniacum TaxID=466084 RepID=UPI002FE6B3C7
MNKWLTKSSLLLTAGLLTFQTGCKDDDEVATPPSVSFEQSELSISETATSAAELVLTLDKASQSAIEVAFKLSGTAEEGVNFQSIEEKTVTFNAGEQTATVFLNPINVASIDGDKQVIIELVSGDNYQVSDDEGKTTVNILDNATTLENATAVAIATSNTVTNPYLQEAVEVTVGLAEALTEDVTLTFDFAESSATIGEDIEIDGLTNGTELVIPAGEVSASFQITPLFKGSAGTDKNVLAKITDISRTDVAVTEGKATFELHLFDPEVALSTWLLERADYADQTGNGAVVVATNENGERAYDEEGNALPSVVVDGIYQPYTQRINPETGSWTAASPAPYIHQDETDANLLKGDWTMTYKTVPKPGSTSYPYYYTYISNAFDIRDIFPSNYLVGYNSSGVKLEKFIRFAATDPDNTAAGKVIIPTQTVTVYRAKDGYEWKGKTYVAETENEEYNYKIDSNETLGDISLSNNVTAIEVTISGEGTYDINAKLIEVTLNFASEDPNLEMTSMIYRMVPLKSDLPN